MYKSLARTWHYARWPLGILALLYVGLVLYRVPVVMEQGRSKEVVADIASQHIILADVQGLALPPIPNQQENDATLAGIDKNNNHIRDDVELAIFKKYPKDARVRAAELQYARALQNELTNVFDSNTLVATIQNEDRASLCITNTAPKVTMSDSRDAFKKAFEVRNLRIKEVDSLVFNTQSRIEKQKEIYKKYMTSYGDENVEPCDVPLESLKTP